MYSTLYRRCITLFMVWLCLSSSIPLHSSPSPLSLSVLIAAYTLIKPDLCSSYSCTFDNVHQLGSLTPSQWTRPLLSSHPLLHSRQSFSVEQTSLVYQDRVHFERQRIHAPSSYNIKLENTDTSHSVVCEDTGSDNPEFSLYSPFHEGLVDIPVLLPGSSHPLLVYFLPSEEGYREAILQLVCHREGIPSSAFMVRILVSGVSIRRGISVEMFPSERPKDMFLDHISDLLYDRETAQIKRIPHEQVKETKKGSESESKSKSERVNPHFSISLSNTFDHPISLSRILYVQGSPTHTPQLELSPSLSFDCLFYTEHFPSQSPTIHIDSHQSPSPTCWSIPPGDTRTIAHFSITAPPAHVYHNPHQRPYYSHIVILDTRGSILLALPIPVSDVDMTHMVLDTPFSTRLSAKILSRVQSRSISHPSYTAEIHQEHVSTQTLVLPSSRPYRSTWQPIVLCNPFTSETSLHLQPHPDMHSSLSLRNCSKQIVSPGQCSSSCIVRFLPLHSGSVSSLVQFVSSSSEAPLRVNVMLRAESWTPSLLFVDIDPFVGERERQSITFAFPAEYFGGETTYSGKSVRLKKEKASHSQLPNYTSSKSQEREKEQNNSLSLSLNPTKTIHLVNYADTPIYIDKVFIDMLEGPSLSYNLSSMTDMQFPTTLNPFQRVPLILEFSPPRNLLQLNQPRAFDYHFVRVLGRRGDLIAIFPLITTPPLDVSYFTSSLFPVSLGSSIVLCLLGILYIWMGLCSLEHMVGIALVYVKSAWLDIVSVLGLCGSGLGVVWGKAVELCKWEMSYLYYIYFLLFGTLNRALDALFVSSLAAVRCVGVFLLSCVSFPLNHILSTGGQGKETSTSSISVASVSVSSTPPIVVQFHCSSGHSSLDNSEEDMDPIPLEIIDYANNDNDILPNSNTNTNNTDIDNMEELTIDNTNSTDEDTIAIIPCTDTSPTIHEITISADDNDMDTNMNMNMDTTSPEIIECQTTIDKPVVDIISSFDPWSSLSLSSPSSPSCTRTPLLGIDWSPSSSHTYSTPRKPPLLPSTALIFPNNSPKTTGFHSFQCRCRECDRPLPSVAPPTPVIAQNLSNNKNIHGVIGRPK